MHLDKHKLNFDELTSEVQKEQSQLLYGIDIDQVKNFKSFRDYFRLETITFYLVLGMTLVAATQKGPLFTFKPINLTSFLISFLFYLLFTSCFSLYQPQQSNYMEIYEKIKGKREDKCTQIYKKFGIFGLSLFMIISAIPFFVIYLISK